MKVVLVVVDGNRELLGPAVIRRCQARLGSKEIDLLSDVS